MRQDDHAPDARGLRGARRGRDPDLGHAVQGVPPHKRDVNTVFQNYALFPHMSAAENVAYGLRQKKVDKGEIGRRVGEALEMVKMSKLADRKPREMSGGQQQRIALARALVNRPSLLLLDEPLGALDRKLREEMQIELKLLQSQVGITFIFVTHDQDEALSMSDRIAVMLDGRIEQLADPDTVYDHPSIGVRGGVHRQAELLRGDIARRGSTVEGDGWTFRSSLEPIGAVDGRGALAAVRPGGRQGVRCASRPDGRNAISGELASISHLGDVIQFVVLTPGRKEIIARLPRPAHRAWRWRSRVVLVGRRTTRTCSGRSRPRSCSPIRRATRRPRSPDETIEEQGRGGNERTG